jgi:hypothetical protein
MTPERKEPGWNPTPPASAPKNSRPHQQAGVIPGLVPGIHPSPGAPTPARPRRNSRMDPRHKAEDDHGEEGARVESDAALVSAEKFSSASTDWSHPRPRAWDPSLSPRADAGPLTPQPPHGSSAQVLFASSRTSEAQPSADPGPSARVRRRRGASVARSARQSFRWVPARSALLRLRDDARENVGPSLSVTSSFLPRRCRLSSCHEQPPVSHPLSTRKEGP